MRRELVIDGLIIGAFAGTALGLITLATMVLFHR